MFDKATRLKLRFATPKGFLTTEDLWDLPLTSARGANLNDLAKSIYKELKDAGDGMDFVGQPTHADEILQLKLDVVKHVISVALAENEALRLARERRDKKERVLEIIARKQDQALEGKSLDELTSMLNDL